MVVDGDSGDDGGDVDDYYVFVFVVVDDGTENRYMRKRGESPGKGQAADMDIMKISRSPKDLFAI